MAIPYYDYFRLVRNRLTRNMFQTFPQNIRTLVRGDDDGEEGHERG